MPDVNVLLHTVTAGFVAVCGWYLNRVLHEHTTMRDKHLIMDERLQAHDKKNHQLSNMVIRLEDNIGRSSRDLDIRLQLAENRAAVMDTKIDAHAADLTGLVESLADIRENMVRRADLEALVSQISRRRPR
jgi:hypothetical protein